MEQGLEWNTYLVGIAVLGALFFCSALYALSWASKRGAFRRFEAQALSIFDESEPVGICSDVFPDQLVEKNPSLKNTKSHF